MAVKKSFLKLGVYSYVNMGIINLLKHNKGEKHSTTGIEFIICHLYHHYNNLYRFSFLFIVDTIVFSQTFQHKKVRFTVMEKVRDHNLMKHRTKRVCVLPIIHTQTHTDSLTHRLTDSFNHTFFFNQWFTDSFTHVHSHSITH